MADSAIKKEPALLTLNWEKDVVYLYSFPREMGKQVPNISPYTVKLETWLRLHEIKYQFIGGLNTSQKGQIPFIELNGEHLADSNFIIKRLSQHFNIDPTEGLTKTELAVSRAFLKMVEENSNWPIFTYRYVNHPEEYKKFYFADEEFWKVLTDHVGKRAVMHGIGRHSEGEQAEIALDDLQAISTYLGEKSFFHGNDITMIDCAIFGPLSQAYFVGLNLPHKEAFRTSCKNLPDYMQRIKNKLWPDWDELVDNSEFKCIDGKWQ